MSRWPQVDFSGQRFGRLTIVRNDAARTSGRERRVICRCDCGIEKSYILQRVRAGQTVSCGCLRLDLLKEQPTGAKSPLWKGDAISYGHAHRRVNRARGKPSRCEHCGTTDPEQTYEWASVSRRYHDPEDYIRLCKPCHAKFDDIGGKSSRARQRSRQGISQ